VRRTRRQAVTKPGPHTRRQAVTKQALFTRRQSRSGPTKLLLGQSLSGFQRFSIWRFWAYLVHRCLSAYQLNKTADRQNWRICKESGKGVDTEYPNLNYARSEQPSLILTKSQYFNT